MKFRSLITAAAFVMISLPALALDLHQARSQGLVGEKSDGYVTALKPSAEVNALVNDVNSKRRTEYTRISKQNGQSIDVVAKLAAPQIAQGLEPGSKYQDASGNWQNK